MAIRILPPDRIRSPRVPSEKPTKIDPDQSRGS